MHLDVEVNDVRGHEAARRSRRLAPTRDGIPVVVTDDGVRGRLFTALSGGCSPAASASSA
ncbi:MAG: hypothetical protein ACR2MO_06510 [Acidimicrobiales bacterium]